MYARFFGLRQHPFSIAPDPRYLFMSERHREALAHLLYGVQGGGGFVLLTGEVGAGKTTVCRCLLEQIPTLGRPNYRLEDWVADPPADYPAGTDPQVPANGVDPRAAQPLTSAPKPIRPTSAKTVRCTAPRLTKQSLKQAKARARKAKCPVKIVRKRIRGKKFGIVTSQSPKANSKIFNGQKLKLVVAKR